MGLESLPSVVFLLLPGFLTWGIFCWGTVTRKTTQIQHLFISLLFSVLTFGIAYPLINLFKLFAINTFATSWDTTIFPGFMQILSEPETLSLEMIIGIYLIAILIGFILIKMYKTGSLAKLLDSIGLDLYGPEGVWYRVFHKPDFITVYLKDGSIVSGWPERFSQTGDKKTSELYLSKLQYFNAETKRWIKASKSVKGLLLNTDSISHIEFRKTEGISGSETRENQPARTRWWHWVEFCSRFIVWIFGLLLASIAVITTINSLPEKTAIMLTIFLIIFLIAALITWYFDVSRLFPPRRR